MNTRELLLREMGITPQWVRRDRLTAATVDIEPVQREANDSPPAVASERTNSESSESRHARIAALSAQALATEISNCRACGLCHARGKAVVGAGSLEPLTDAQPRWFVVAAAPTDAEDRSGQSFVGPAGVLLDAMLAAVGVSRKKSAYITHLVKCQPPGNRMPHRDEILACAPILNRQIALTQPAVIVALGSATAQLMSASDSESSQSEDTALHFAGAKGATVAHPTELLEKPQLKAAAWADLLRARALANGR
ncbi:MAG: uracil-DNA glycosylase [Betaproteobacteria bacterium]|nr:MAG: uracil-DNA glycosylase [Betaproteobacteria bacterium]